MSENKRKIIIPRSAESPKDETSVLFSQNYEKIYIPYGILTEVPEWVYESAVRTGLINAEEGEED